ncbi:3-oxoacyl-[acyl-carrier-protein] reductase FabG [Fonsecaea pedrosoi]|nr:3-oxoacyl-[acyl-carrier-protein] reductase FabG [Fonsecaea pedrosoi]
MATSTSTSTSTHNRPRPAFQDEPIPIYPDLPGKVAIVTGIGQFGDPAVEDNWGNGAAAAFALARSGVKVFGCDVDLAAAERTKRRIEKHVPGAVVDVAVADATDSASIEAFVRAVTQRHNGRVDILVNNVGGAHRGGPVEMPEELWDQELTLNLKSVYLMCHFVLPVLTAQPAGGAVINIGSIAGLRYIGKPQAAYAAAKAGVHMFTKHTAVYYADKGVRINVVVPGLISTPLVSRIAEYYGGDYDEFVRTRNAQVPTGEMGTSADVANAILFLASSVASRHMTGQELVIDGGMTSSTGSVNSGMAEK